MPQSLASLNFHLVFSTKERQPWLADEVGPRVFAYLGGMVREEGGVALLVNGMPDHVHLLVKLRQDKALSDALAGMDETLLKVVEANKVALQKLTEGGASSEESSVKRDSPSTASRPSSNSLSGKSTPLL